MNINFKDIKRDHYGRIENPLPMLLKPHGEIICPIGRYFNLELNLKYSECSTAKFVVPACSNGVNTQNYDDIASGKPVRIDPYGVYIIDSVERSGNGVREVKNCECKSLEFELNSRQITFAAGTYPLYNPVDPGSSLLGMALENAPGWKIGSVAASLWSRYRTFDQTDMTIYEFFMSSAQESYGCVFLFDTYTRTITALDAGETASQMPVYLSFQNLLKEVQITEHPDKMANRVSVTGADGVSIRNVNPTGSNFIINLDYWVQNGDLPETVAHRYQDWQNELAAQQASYTSLVAVRNSISAGIITEKAVLTDLKAELTSLENLRSTSIQGRAMATKSGPETEAGTVAYFDKRLSEIAAEYQAQEQKIAAQEERLRGLNKGYEDTAADIAAVNNALKYESYFTSEERGVLDHYFIDGFIEDGTFAVFDVDVSGKNDSFIRDAQAAISFKDVSVVDIPMTGIWACADCNHSFRSTGTPRQCPECGGANLQLTSGPASRILSLSGGTISITGEAYSLSADLISGTLDYKDGTDVVFSAYLFNGKVNGDDFPSGNLSCVCKSGFDLDAFLGGMEKFVEEESAGDAVHQDVHYKGSGEIASTENAFYFTRNVTEYQRYSVEQDLYDHAVEKLKEMAAPTCEFSVKSGNLIWAQEFEPFKDALQLGSAVYLKLNDATLLKPILLEVKLDFENPGNFDLVFTNEFQITRPDFVHQMLSVQKKAEAAGRTLSSEKFKYKAGELSGAAKAVDEFMRTGVNTAYQQVTAGPEQNVVINEAGVKVGTPGSSEYIMLSNGMIALVDDVKKSARMAMGHFYSQEYGTDYYGIMADLVFGNLIAGKGLSIACQDVNDGSMLFEANSKGVQLHNGRFYIDHDRGGKIMLDPTYGFAIGTKELYSLDENGKLVLNEENASLYIDLQGNLHMKGNVYATDGVFNGTVYAKSGEFSGTLKATTLDGKLVGGGENGGVIEGVGLNIGDGNFVVDQSGNLTMSGNINLSGGNITWGANAPTKKQFSVSASGPWHETMQAGDKWRQDWDYASEAWGAAYQFRGEDGRPGADGSNGSDASVTRGNIVRAMLQNIEEDGLYTTNINGKQCLGINASAIRSGVIEGIDIYGGSYYDLKGVGRLNLSNGGNFSDLIFTNVRAGRELFKIKDEQGVAILYLCGMPVIEASTLTGNHAYLTNNVEVQAKFG